MSNLRTDSLPRRCHIDRLTPAETAIREAMRAVEKAGAHPLLTDAVMLLDEARNKVADFVDADLRHTRALEALEGGEGETVLCPGLAG